MASTVEITSKVMIIPSSPTPHHLKNLKLSFLDQVEAHCYVNLIFFYNQVNHPNQLQQSLKKSLSKVLTEFYPLAGRLSRKNFTVDCNDEGAFFIDCKVHENMPEVIKNPTVDECQKYLAIGSSNKEDENIIVLAVQVNLFDCRGIAVAVQMHHNVADANSIVSFMNAWAAVFRSSDDHKTISPRFDMADLFPPKDTAMVSSYFSEPPNWFLSSTEKLVTKRLLFDKKELENLKLQATDLIKDPTRVEAVSSFLLKRFRDVMKARGSKKGLAFLHAVNLRLRMDPPLPNHAFGNVLGGAIGLVGEDEDLVSVLRNAIRKIDGEYVNNLQNGDGFFNFLTDFGAMCLKGEPWCFSSWTRFPVYEVDYGWGKPVWVFSGVSETKNVVCMMPTRSGEGMEVGFTCLKKMLPLLMISIRSTSELIHEHTCISIWPLLLVSLD